MNEKRTELRSVRELSPETARKIAAGEVIDRPSAIIRELLDNAVDSGASYIQTEIDGGGIDRIRVADNGAGMTKEDLENCAKPHATSKILSENDLLTLSTLGFRGEALASIAAVSRLEITSIRSEHAWKLEVGISENRRLTVANLAQGTVVQSCGLFENFPARRVFLKRPASEAQLCKQVFIEKAIPQTSIAFRLSIDSKTKLDLPSEQSAAERFVSALELKEPPSLFYEIAGTDEQAGFSFTCVLGEPSVHRSDKKMIFIYINGRRIWEYSLVQAIEYGSQGYFPNGTFPLACLFVQMNPALVDFNIHPAKKEARFKDISVLHHAVSSAVRNFYKNYSASQLVRQTAVGQMPERTEHDATVRQNLFSDVDKTGSASIIGNKRPSYGELPRTGHYSPHIKPTVSSEQFFKNRYHQAASFVSPNQPKTESSQLAERAQNPNTARRDFKYIGSALGVFIIIEKNDKLYLIDQHAAQERILYNKFMAAIGEKQELLFPYVIETETEADDAYLETILDELRKAGFTLHNVGGGRWEAHAVPAKWNGTEEDLAKDLLKNRVAPTELCAKLAASYVCRCAVKDGTVLDAATATDLAGQSLELADPHCPHGRPIWTVIAKTELFKLVRRSE